MTDFPWKRLKSRGFAREKKHTHSEKNSEGWVCAETKKIRTIWCIRCRMLELGQISIVNLSWNLFISVKGDDGVYAEIASDDVVVLGAEMKVTFEVPSSELPIHVENCLAKDKAPGGTSELALVTEDCHLERFYFCFIICL